MVTLAKLKPRVFEFSLLETPEAEVETLPSGRTYKLPDGAVFQSVTTFLKKCGDQKGLDAWKEWKGEEKANQILMRAGERGTYAHDNIEAYLKGLPMVEGDYFMMFKKFKNILNMKVGKILCLEGVLYSLLLMLAGRVDMVAYWDGKLSVVDFKSALKPKKESGIQNYFLQATIYAMMLREMFGIEVEQIVILIANERDHIVQEFIKPAFEFEEKVIKLRKKHAD